MDLYTIISIFFISIIRSVAYNRDQLMWMQCLERMNHMFIFHINTKTWQMQFRLASLL